MCLVGWACFSSLAFGEIVKDDVFVEKDFFYSFDQVCKTLLKRESPLIDAKSLTELDCMGKTVDINDFCKNEFKEDTSYARAKVMADTKKVRCQRASRVIMGYKCVGDGGLCEDKDIGCFKLGERFAANLRLSHSSVIDEGASKKLNCYFSSLGHDDVLKPRFNSL